MLNQSKYIKTIPFTGLFNWDAKCYLTDNSLKILDKALLRPFSYFTQAAKIDKVKIEDNEEYKILGVRSYGYGAYQNRISKGKDLKMKVYQQAKVNHLFWCKVDTKNGAFGIITEELADGLGSSNMTFAELNLAKISVDYLQLLFKSKILHSYMDNMVTGTTNRKYIKFSDLLSNVKIPLPSLAEQNALVADYNELIETANSQELQAKNLEQQIETYLLAQLGVAINKTEKRVGLNFVSFKDVSRWDIAYFFSNSELKSRFANVRLEDCLSRFMKSDQGKSIRVETYKQPTTKFHYIGMEHVMRDTGELVEMPEVWGADIKSQTIAIPQGYFIYGKLRPYLNKYWVNDRGMNDIVCSSEFFVFKIKKAINEAFFKYVISSIVVQKQIEELTSGARMPRINEDIFKNIVIPLPPLEVQNEIVAHITGLKEQIKQLRTEATTNRTTALTDFEQKIFV